jgi:hypothetical protein
MKSRNLAIVVTILLWMPIRSASATTPNVDILFAFSPDQYIPGISETIVQALQLEMDALMTASVDNSDMPDAEKEG